LDFNALFTQIINLVKNLNKQQKIVIAVTMVVIVALISFLIVYNSSNRVKGDDGFRVLFDNLADTDAALIVQNLEKNKIPYKIPEDGVIEVPKELVQKVRLQVASLGLPKKSVVGFELFDKQEFGATDFEQNIKYLRALEGELSKTIEAINVVRSAKVNIAIPKESLFVSQQTPVTASVMVELQPNMILTSKQIRGIKYLVASAVPKLEPKNVTLIDQNGEPLGDDSELEQNNELLKMELLYKKRYEENLRKKIISLLTPLIGSNRIGAMVNVEFDFSKITSKSEIFSPDNVVRSEQTMEESREGYSPKQVGGVPGAVSNIGPVQGLKDGALKEKYNKATTTTNYEISKTVKHTIGDLVKIKRVTASVVSDWIYETNETTGKGKYVPLTKEQLASITHLVKNTIGFNKQRGDDVTVSCFPFNKGAEEREGTSPKSKVAMMITNYLTPFEPVLKWLFLFIVLFIFYKKVILPFSEKMLELKQEDEEELKRREIEIEEEEIEDHYDKLRELKAKVEQQLGINNDINQEDLKYEVLLERVKEIAEEKTEEVANVLVSLLKENEVEKG
jgi:flagellar M-ring protein FliF